MKWKHQLLGSKPLANNRVQKKFRAILQDARGKTQVMTTKQLQDHITEMNNIVAVKNGNVYGLSALIPIGFKWFNADTFGKEYESYMGDIQDEDKVDNVWQAIFYIKMDV